MNREKWGPRQEAVQEALKRLRKEASLTQVELAKKLDRPQTYISKYELGERRLDLIEIQDICTACNITLTQFIEAIEPLLTKHLNKG